MFENEKVLTGRHERVPGRHGGVAGFVFSFRPPESIQTDSGPKRAWENNQELIIQKVPAKFIKFYIYFLIHTSRGIAWNCALQSKASVRLQSVAQQIG